MTQKAYKKRMLTILLACLIAVTTVVGVSLAYMFDKSAPVTNKLTFVGGTGGNALSGKLEEVWNPADGLNLLPGATVTKKPTIKNTSTAEVSEWACMQVVYEKLSDTGVATAMTSVEVAALLEVIEIDFNATAWEKEGVSANANKVRYYHNTPLTKGASTAELFTKVTVKATADNSKIDAVSAFAPGGINIRLEGAVIQSQGLAYNAAKTELDAILPNT